MRLELAEEKALRQASKGELQRLEVRKDEHLRELAAELGSVQAINKRLESELQRAKDLIEQQKEAISHLSDELKRKDGAIQNLATLNQESVNSNQDSEELEQLRVENRSLKNTNIDLENHINAIQDKLSHIESEGMRKHPIKDTINRWKSISKDTRDWTKANQLLNELEQLIK